MARHINLRQIEAFKAVIEYGTISRGAEMLHISQPAMSKLIAHLETDTGLKLFDRLKGRLAPTALAMRLSDEIGRIFAGVRQVENAVDAIRRAEQGRIAIGVMPALAGSFIQRTTSSFLKSHPKVFCSVESPSSQWIVDRLIAGQLDVGVVGAGIANPYVTRERLMEHPLVCIMPLKHPLAAKRKIKPKDLHEAPFVSLQRDTYSGRLAAEMLESYSIEPNIVLVADTMTMQCDFVAAGLGVALVHPLVAGGLQRRLVVRRFEPDILISFQLCRSVGGRNAQLVEAYAQELRATAAQISTSMMGDV
jgi:DNA-binding transcriptional LysR family regulator